MLSLSANSFPGIQGVDESDFNNFFFSNSFHKLFINFLFFIQFISQAIVGKVNKLLMVIGRDSQRSPKSTTFFFCCGAVAQEEIP